MSRGSTLSDRGLAQTTADAALDVFRTTILHDPNLAIFHGGVVEDGTPGLSIAQRVDVFRYTQKWQVVVGSRGIRTTQEYLGGGTLPLELFAEFRWPEVHQERKLGQIGVAGLHWYFEHAIRQNDQLCWEETWGDPPAGSAIKKGGIHAREGIIQRPTTLHGESIPRDKDGKPVPGKACALIDLFVVVYGIAMEPPI